MTVSGLTSVGADRQSRQVDYSHSHRSRSEADSFVRFGPLRNAKLMAKREDLKRQCRSSSEKRPRCAKQRQ